MCTFICVYHWRVELLDWIVSYHINSKLNFMENAWCREAQEKDERNNEEMGRERVSG